MDVPESFAAGTSNSDPDIANLITRLGDPDRELQSDAIHALIDLGAPAVPSLLEAAVGADRPTRLSALHVLTRIGDSRAGPLCSSIYFDPASDLFLRYTALVGIGRCRADGAFELLSEVLQRPDTDQDAKRLEAAAVEGLGGLGDRRAVTLLLPFVGADPKAWPPRYVVISALGNLGDEAAVDALLALLEAEPLNPDPRVIMALGRIGSPAAGPALRRILEHAPEIAEAIVARRGYRPDWRERYRRQILELLLERVQAALLRIEAS